MIALLIEYLSMLCHHCATGDVTMVASLGWRSPRRYFHVLPFARRFTGVCAPILRGLGNFLPRNGRIERRPSSRSQRFRLIANIIWVKLRKAADVSEVSRAAKEPLLGVGSFLKCVSTAPIRSCRVRERTQHNSSE